MLRSSPAILTLIATLAHSVLGCCWHHVHAHEFGSGCVQSHQAAQIVESAHPEHCHNHPSPQAPGGDQHDHDGGCDESRCEYLRTPSVVVANPGFAWASALRADNLSSSVDGSVPCRWSAFSTRPSLSAQPVRAETQVWLL